MTNIFIGRQPIFDRNLNVHAYELLFRASQENRAPVINGDKATSQVVVNAFMEIGLDNVVGKHPAYINFTRTFLTNEQQLPFPKDRVVLEVLENMRIDEPLINAVRNLAGQGYTIALDDFVYNEKLRPLVEVANVIKIDITILSETAVEEHFRLLREFPVKLLAEKVETEADFERCKELGFDLFQGYFLSKPNVLSGQRVPANRLAILQLLAAIQNPEVDAKELDRRISQDVSLSYRLLRYINSAFFALPRKVESIQQAVVYLGLQAIKTWVSLISLAGIDDKPHELITTSLIRAKMCEELAKMKGIKRKDTCFTTGLFSTLDAMMDIPMETVLEKLPLADDISKALLNYEGELGEILKCALDYERGNWDAVDQFGVDSQLITEAYLEALSWADDASSRLAA